MRILNILPEKSWEGKPVYYLPGENALEMKGLNPGQIQEGDEIKIAAAHTECAKLRRNKREGDIKIICTATSGFNYSWSSYQPLYKLEADYETQNSVILWLEENKAVLMELEEFGGKPVIKDKTDFGYWEMQGLKSLPVANVSSADRINPPHEITYASSGILTDDVAWFDGKNLFVVLKGTQIRFGIN